VHKRESKPILDECTAKVEQFSKDNIKFTSIIQRFDEILCQKISKSSLPNLEHIKLLQFDRSTSKLSDYICTSTFSSHQTSLNNLTASLTSQISSLKSQISSASTHFQSSLDALSITIAKEA
jgi:hypothetical protein